VSSLEHFNTRLIGSAKVQGQEPPVSNVALLVLRRFRSSRYIGLDVNRETISAAVLDEDGKRLMQSVFATQAPAVLEFLHGIKGTLHVTFEEGTHSAWLYDLLVRRVAKVVVCNPRKSALLKSGSKSDAIDARKLAELLRNDSLAPVYHGENSAGGGAASGAQLHHADRGHHASDGTVESISQPSYQLHRQEAV
jgi:Transposase